MIRAGVVGATGYAGAELLRLLAGHDRVEIAAACSRSEAGVPVGRRLPNLRGRLDLDLSAPDDPALGECDVVFYATPHGAAMRSAPALLDRGARVIDLSADFRLRDIALWERWYGIPHAAPDLAAEAVYGLPETARDAIRRAALVAVPGCYPTAVLLGFLPLLENRLVDPGRLIADAKSGVSGAGLKLARDYLLGEASESVRAYGVAGHRHHPEICAALEPAAEASVGLAFVPHLAPMIRGLLATLYASEKEGAGVTAARLQAAFEERYAGEPFVEVLPAGELPATRDARGGNRCVLSVSHLADSRTVVVVAAEDNLIKGAAGQAVQNMNIMFGLDETLGLDGIAPLP